MRGEERAEEDLIPVVRGRTCQKNPRKCRKREVLILKRGPNGGAVEQLSSEPERVGDIELKKKNGGIESRQNEQIPRKGLNFVAKR